MATILMSKSERKWLAVTAQVVSGKLDLRSASELLGLRRNLCLAGIDRRATVGWFMVFGGSDRIDRRTQP